MSNFQGVSAVSIQASDGGAVQAGINLGLNGKVLFDQPAAAGVFDFTPYLAGLTVKALLVKAIGTDFTVSLDGTNFSTRKHQTLYAELTDVGAAPLKLTLTGPATRLQLLAIGDP